MQKGKETIIGAKRRGQLREEEGREEGSKQGEIVMEVKGKRIW